jgi:HAD superfamily hydrolase (TIGR01459 family)
MERSARVGVTPDLYDHLMSSGEETWQALKERTDPWYAALGRRVLLFAAEYDRPFLAGLGLEEASGPEDADFLLVTGAASGETVADYESRLAAAASAGVPMVCANPDLEVMRGEAREICAGAIALAYEERGGRVRYHGKPHIGVYRRCFAALGGMAATRILAVGDSLRTDIAGAAAAGTDSLLILGGILEEQLGGPESIAAAAVDPARVGRLLDSSAARPGLLMARFGW